MINSAGKLKKKKKKFGWKNTPKSIGHYKFCRAYDKFCRKKKKKIWLKKYPKIHRPL
jgi:hypothetical protein